MHDTMPENNPIPQNGDIREQNGRREYHANGYWIKYYEPHKKGDLNAALKLVGNFEWRFLKAVESGMEASADPSRVDHQRKLFADAQTRKDAIKDRASPEYMLAEEDEQVYGGMLAVSIFRRMISDIKQHITYRMQPDKLGPADITHLKHLGNMIDADVREVYALFPYVRRSGGDRDMDEVLAEMRGEPMMVLSSTLPKSDSGKLAMFYDNRYLKISQCWKDIDAATAAVQELVSSSSSLKNSVLPDLIGSLSAAAKSRCELMRSDPDFDVAAANLRATRNQIKKFTPEHGGRHHAAAVTKNGDNDILALVRRYRKLVYDIAHVRTPRHFSTEQLVKDIDHRLNLLRHATIVP